MTKKRERKFAKLCLIMTTILFVTLLTSSCIVGKSKEIYIDTSDLGGVDFYGFIIKGEFAEGVYERIKDKDVAVVSKGLLYKYLFDR